jgi:TonB family protein
MLQRVKVLLGTALALASVLVYAAEEPAAKCRTPPKPIGKHGKYMPPTGLLPDGLVHVEFTVATDGTVHDVAIVQSSDERLEAWALVKATDTKFAPIETPCRARAALRHRNTEHPDGRP